MHRILNRGALTNSGKSGHIDIELSLRIRHLLQKQLFPVCRPKEMIESKFVRPVPKALSLAKCEPATTTFSVVNEEAGSADEVIMILIE